MTLGDVTVPVTFTLTNNDATPDVISSTALTVSGPGADDYWRLGPGKLPITQPAGDITLAPGGTCQFNASSTRTLGPQMRRVRR